MIGSFDVRGRAIIVPALNDVIGYFFFETDIRLVLERFFTVPPTPLCRMTLAASFISFCGTCRILLGLPLSFKRSTALGIFWRLRSISVAVLPVAESSRRFLEIGTSLLPGALDLALL